MHHRIAKITSRSIHHPLWQKRYRYSRTNLEPSSSAASAAPSSPSRPNGVHQRTAPGSHAPVQLQDSGAAQRSY
jgi:hypothetical protein